MKWEIEYTDEFERWWETLTEEEQESITVSVSLLEVMGPNGYSGEKGQSN